MSTCSVKSVNYITQYFDKNAQFSFLVNTILSLSRGICQTFSGFLKDLRMVCRSRLFR